MSHPEIQPLFITLPKGAVAKVTIEVIEETMPTPSEIPVVRPATIHDLQTITDQLVRRKYHFHLEHA